MRGLSKATLCETEETSNEHGSHQHTLAKDALAALLTIDASADMFVAFYLSGLAFKPVCMYSRVTPRPESFSMRATRPLCMRLLFVYDDENMASIRTMYHRHFRGALLPLEQQSKHTLPVDPWECAVTQLHVRR